MSYRRSLQPDIFSLEGRTSWAEGVLLIEYRPISECRVFRQLDSDLLSALGLRLFDFIHEARQSLGRIERNNQPLDGIDARARPIRPSGSAVVVQYVLDTMLWIFGCIFERGGCGEIKGARRVVGCESETRRRLRIRGGWEVLMYVSYRVNLAAGLPNSDQRSRLSLCTAPPIAFARWPAIPGCKLRLSSDVIRDPH